MRVIHLDKAQSDSLLRRGWQAAEASVKSGLCDPEKYYKAQKLIDLHRDLKLDKLVITT